MGIVRYTITCCTADAMPCGLLCEYEHASSLKTGSWVQINGTIAMTQIKNSDYAEVKIKSVRPAKEPENPYVYPAY